VLCRLSKRRRTTYLTQGTWPGNFLICCGCGGIIFGLMLVLGAGRGGGPKTGCRRMSGAGQCRDDPDHRSDKQQPG
jgi:hypothetical protein